MCPGPWTKYNLHTEKNKKDICILGCAVLTHKVFFLLRYKVFTSVSLLSFKINI